MKTVTLQAVAMVTTNDDFIYAPSRIWPTKEIAASDLADDPRQILVSFEPDGRSNPQRVTAYSTGLDCWYIVVDRK